MSGLFRDPSDANRKLRGARPYTGPSQNAGNGPLKANPVRRQTVAPFESPFAERKRPSPLPVQAVSPVPAPETVAPPLTEPTASAPVEAPVPPLQRESIPPVIEATTSELKLSPAPAHEEIVSSALRTEDLLSSPSAETENLIQSAVPEESTNGTPYDAWFAESEVPTEEEDLSEAPFDNIESLEATPLPAAWTPPADEPAPEQLPLAADWAVSPDGEAELHAYVAETRSRELATEALEAVARRVRSGEIVVALEPGATTEAILASILASLLTDPT